MKLIAAAVAGLVTVGAGTASAQPMWGPEQGRYYERGPLFRDRPGWVGAINPQQAAYLIESMGLDPIGPPLRTGHLIVQRASDDLGRMVRVTIDLNIGRVVSVAPANGVPPPVNGGPYAAYRPYGPGPYARPAPDADDDDEFGPPRGPAMVPRADLPPPGPYAPGPGAVPPRSTAVAPYPPSVIEAAPTAPRSATRYPTPAYPANPQAAVPPKDDKHKPATKAATATPTNPPVPRKRPDNPQAAATKSAPGSVAPVQPAPVPATPSAATPAPAPGAAPAGPAGAMPPVAPLE
jgi:hypothetical protein